MLNLPRTTQYMVTAEYPLNIIIRHTWGNVQISIYFNCYISTSTSESYHLAMYTHNPQRNECGFSYFYQTASRKTLQTGQA